MMHDHDAGSLRIDHAGRSDTEYRVIIKTPTPFSSKTKSQGLTVPVGQLLEAVKLLADSNVNAQSRYGCTALYLAAEEGGRGRELAHDLLEHRGAAAVEPLAGQPHALTVPAATARSAP